MVRSTKVALGRLTDSLVVDSGQYLYLWLSFATTASVQYQFYYQNPFSFDKNADECKEFMLTHYNKLSDEC